MAVSVSEYEKALAALKNALQHPKTDMNRDATIQRYEFVIELAWKTARKVMGTQTVAPKDVIREMARTNLIDDPAIWFEALEIRNLAAHTYNEAQADKAYSFAISFYPQAEGLLDRLKKK